MKVYVFSLFILNKLAYFKSNGNLISSRCPFNKLKMPICMLMLFAARHVIRPYVCVWSFMPINENEVTVAVLLMLAFACKRSHCFSLITPDTHFHEMISPDSVQPYNNFGLFGSHCVAMIFLPGTPSKSRTYSPVFVLYTRIWSSAMTNNELQKNE